MRRLKSIWWAIIGELSIDELNDLTETTVMLEQSNTQLRGQLSRAICVLQSIPEGYAWLKNESDSLAEPIQATLDKQLEEAKRRGKA